MERIEKIRIPDEDVGEWREVLHKAGLSFEQIDDFMIRLNKTYAEVSRFIDQEVEKVFQNEKAHLEGYGVEFDEETWASLRRGIEKRIKDNY